MAKFFICLILSLCGLAIVDANEVQFIIRPSQSQCCGDQWSNASCVDNDLTLSQFVDNFSDFFTNDTTLIFLPGNYSLESELIIENVHSFSLFACSGSASKAVITCGNNARLDFRNVSIISVSGLEFEGCFENHVLSVDHFQLENSVFFGSGQANGTVLTIDESSTKIYGSKFLRNVGDTIVHVNDANIVISDSIFTNNTGSVLVATYTNMSINHSEFVGNKGYSIAFVRSGTITSIDCSKFINNTGSRVLHVENASLSISNSGFIGNEIVNARRLNATSIDFMNNNEFYILCVANSDMVSITHSEFIDNLVKISSTVLNGISVGSPLLYIDGLMTTISLSKFISNRVGSGIVYIRYYTTAENLTIFKNVFIDNTAAYEVYINYDCRPGLSLSLGSSRCIQCSENWLRNLIGIVVAAVIAGIVLIIFMLAFNMTVAVGTLNGILFYANIVVANADTYFLPFTTTNFITVFISWLNLDIGFDVCFLYSSLVLDEVAKALLQLAFPAYVIVLVVIVIVASECSSKFAKMISKGNPVAVLATMILLSYAKFINTISASFSLLHHQSAYGSRNVDVTKFGSVLTQYVEQSSDLNYRATVYFLLFIFILIFLLCLIFSVLVFSWQWLLQYQNKAIFKWVRYQKLHYFLEPYHAPYTAKYRYWTGLLLLVRILLYLVSALNFSLDPRVDLMATILVVGSLILLKGVIAKRIYRNWPLDVMETVIYFNLVAFSAFTWYNLEFGGNQVAVAYTSVMIIFILLLGVIVFHVLRYTRLYRCSFIEKAFKWTSSKLLEKMSTEQPLNDAPEELDGYSLFRSAAGDQELPIITHSVIEINQPAQNKE